MHSRPPPLRTQDTNELQELWTNYLACGIAGGIPPQSKPEQVTSFELALNLSELDLAAGKVQAAGELAATAEGAVGAPFVTPVVMD